MKISAAATILAVLAGPTASANRQSPPSVLQFPTSNLQPPTSNLQPPTSNLQPPPASLQSAINNLGKFEAPVRTAASRDVRRAPAAQAVPALMAAASGHADGYVRFRALVLLAGFNDSRAREVMLSSLDEPNDRLRTVAYAYFEHNPERGMAARLLKAAEKEDGEFVRPALTRALAAYGTEPEVQKALSALVLRGQDLYRSAVIEALGDYKAAYAYTQIAAVSKLDGPLQEDAILALGKLGDKRALAVLQDLQRSAPRTRQPAVAAAICLIGVNCESHQKFVIDTMTFATTNIGFQDLLRASAKALAALAVSGREDAMTGLLETGIPARDPARSPLALALGTVAVRNTPLALRIIGARTDLRQSALLLRDAFDMLEEDFEEERFFATVRRGYWQAAEGSPARKIAETLIQVLEF
jgi:HEAT repeat protein